MATTRQDTRLAREDNTREDKARRDKDKTGENKTMARQDETMTRTGKVNRRSCGLSDGGSVFTRHDKTITR